MRLALKNPTSHERLILSKNTVVMIVFIVSIIILRLIEIKNYFLIMRTFTQPQTYNSYFLNSIGTWKVCKKPKRKPDHISYKRNFKRIHLNDDPFTCLGDNQKYYKHHFEEEYDNYIRVYYEDKRLGISSRYWYGEDSKGKYVIRESDHWGKVASCIWRATKDLKNRKLKTAKIYLKQK